MRAIGLMSGTSLDGMDAALVRVRRRVGAGPGGYRANLEAFRTLPYPAALRRIVSEIAHGAAVDARTLAEADRGVAELGARAAAAVARKADVPLGGVGVIGSHGQTVFHGPAIDAGPTTMQIGSPARIANLTGATTVGDFRTADLAAGGCGAPLMPIVHRMLAADAKKRRAVQNIGGIGNVTWLGRGGRKMTAFDTGPGVMLIDRMTGRVSRGQQRFDRGGRFARRGRIDRELVAELLREPYFRRRPPKATGREAFGEGFAREFEERARTRGARGADLVATATAFTAASIADQYRRFLLPRLGLDEVLLAGGGARNPALVAMLQDELGEIPVRPIESIGVDGDALEAIGFAILAVAALDGAKFDLSGVTGSRRAVRLGVIARP
ncbi:MAG: anhydro-N-acetylmuramic acid kinase [Candidatus Binatia bacterium]|nr:anhydro-N-acetylmuramic acid kinase [Candidatus Binatia bacterium]